MNEPPSWTRVFFEITRISNLPTVMTNTLVGFAIGMRTSEGSSFFTLIFAAVGLSLLYLGGMVLNDVCDAKWDAAHRSKRPIPAGHISSRDARWLAAILFIVGVLAVSFCGTHAALAAVTLIISIALYNMLHKRTGLASIFMGVCRGMVYVTAALAVTDSPDLVLLSSVAGAMAVYTILLTVIASVETKNEIGWRRWLIFPMEAVILLPLFVVGEVQSFGLAMFMAVAALGWIGQASRFILKKKVKMGRSIQAWIAGIALIDAFFLSLIGWDAMALVAIGFFALTLLWQRRISGT